MRAARALAEKVAKGELRPEDIDEAAMCSEMYTHGQKDPDFILRPSGEHRLSNFMLWQVSYAEMWFTDKLWPDFKPRDLHHAILDYQHRGRRFGGV